MVLSIEVKAAILQKIVIFKSQIDVILTNSVLIPHLIMMI